jgi:hypothetical protein
MPQRPNPELRIVEPLRTSATAASAFLNSFDACFTGETTSDVVNWRHCVCVARTVSVHTHRDVRSITRGRIVDMIETILKERIKQDTN